MQSPPLKSVLIQTLGCDKNTVDSEMIAGALADRGLRPISPDSWDGESPLDAIVVNTCAFIDTAKQQSIDAIIEWGDYKEELGGKPQLVVAGCLSQRYHEDLKTEMPEIDAIVGVGAWDQIADLLARRDQPAPTPEAEPHMRMDARINRLPLDAEPHRFLRISDGCNQRCTFCSIPSMKGRHLSVPIETLVDEMKRLVDTGAKEINLVAQDLTSYGIDMHDGTRLADLLAKLDAVEGDHWIRLFYAYPARIDDRLIETIAGAQHVIPYLDMPLQHASSPMLKAMRRPGDQTDVVALLARLREGIPNLVMRTTFIVGFPGETDQDFDELLTFVKEQRFERMGSFLYQPQEGTPSAEMPTQIPEEDKEDRQHTLMSAQLEISEAIQRERFEGQTLKVLVEGYEPELQVWRSRSFADAPEIDGTTWIDAEPRALEKGQFAEVEIQATDPYDMRATLVP